jgi:UDP-glucose 4-epimerase
MKNILITGGAGMIGSNLSSELVNLGYNVIVLDDFSSGLDINIPSTVTLIRGSVTDDLLLTDIFAKYKISYIFHLAALFANQNSVDHPEKDLDINGLGTLKMLRYANKQYELGNLERFFYASSSCVYGGQGGALNEESEFHLETPYAITKLLGEYYSNYFHHLYRLPITIFRFFNSYGPGELPGKYRNVIPNFIQSALLGNTLFITGDGKETRDFTFIGDTIRGIILAMNSSNTIGKTYNIATGKETTILELAQLIIELTNSSSTIEFKERRNWDNTLNRKGDVTLLSTDVGYCASTDLRIGLIKTIDWIKSATNQ